MFTAYMRRVKQKYAFNAFVAVRQKGDLFHNTTKCCYFRSLNKLMVFGTSKTSWFVCVKIRTFYRIMIHATKSGIGFLWYDNDSGLNASFFFVAHDPYAS